jgi:hypothetical protein
MGRSFVRKCLYERQDVTKWKPSVGAMACQLRAAMLNFETVGADLLDPLAGAS